MEVPLIEAAQTRIIVERPDNQRITAITAVAADITLGVVTLAVVAGMGFPVEVVVATSKRTIPGARLPATRARQIDISPVDLKNITNVPITYILHHKILDYFFSTEFYSFNIIAIVSRSFSRPKANQNRGKCHYNLSKNGKEIIVQLIQIYTNI